MPLYALMPEIDANNCTEIGIIFPPTVTGWNERILDQPSDFRDCLWNRVWSNGDARHYWLATWYFSTDIHRILIDRKNLAWLWSYYFQFPVEKRVWLSCHRARWNAVACKFFHRLMNERFLMNPHSFLLPGCLQQPRKSAFDLELSWSYLGTWGKYVCWG